MNDLRARNDCSAAVEPDPKTVSPDELPVRSDLQATHAQKRPLELVPPLGEARPEDHSKGAWMLPAIT